MISDRGKRDDILWFTLFHEIAHLIKHSKKEIFIDDKKEIFIDDDNIDKTEIELEANNYAKNILIKDTEYNNFIKNNRYTEKQIKDFAKANNVNTGIVIGRLQKDGIVGWSDFNNLITRL